MLPPVKSIRHLQRYVALIERFGNKDYSPREVHHIVPRCYGGDHSPENLVICSPRLHFLLHWCLWKAFDDQKMAFAFWSMTSRRSVKASKVYQKLRAEIAQAVSDSKKGVAQTEEHVRNRMLSRSKTITPEWREARSKAMKSVICTYSNSLFRAKMSEEAKKKISESKLGKAPPNKGKLMSDAQKAKISKTMGQRSSGRRWITDGVSDRFTKDLTPSGWYEGRSKNRKLAKKPRTSKKKLVTKYDEIKTANYQKWITVKSEIERDMNSWGWKERASEKLGIRRFAKWITRVDPTWANLYLKVVGGEVLETSP